MIIVIGKYPPEKCGVGDYVFNLKNSEGAKRWSIFYTQNWNLSSILNKIRAIKLIDDDYINIQYPSVGYGRSVVPHLLCIFFKFSKKYHISVTLHEFSQIGWEGKICALMFLIFAERIVFTSSFEMENANKFFKVKNKSAVIKIGSNIKPCQLEIPFNNKQYDVCYFGTINPNKGIETFLNCITKLQKINKNIKVCIIGNTLPSYENYYIRILEEASEIGIKLILNKEESDVSASLANTKIAYLPFPDGVSERRGSLLACIVNKCIIVTKKGMFTTKSHENVCFFADKSRDEQLIIELLNKDSNFYDSYFKKSNEFILSEVPSSWNEIVKHYNSFLTC
jgi:glycosyltransferase involved in cell wall biosynthesis